MLQYHTSISHTPILQYHIHPCFNVTYTHVQYHIHPCFSITYMCVYTHASVSHESMLQYDVHPCFSITLQYHIHPSFNITYTHASVSHTPMLQYRIHPCFSIAYMPSTWSQVSPFFSSLQVKLEGFWALYKGFIPIWSRMVCSLLMCKVIAQNGHDHAPSNLSFNPPALSSLPRLPGLLRFGSYTKKFVFWLALETFDHNFAIGFNKLKRMRAPPPPSPPYLILNYVTCVI